MHIPYMILRSLNMIASSKPGKYLPKRCVTTIADRTIQGAILHAGLQRRGNWVYMKSAIGPSYWVDAGHKGFLHSRQLWLTGYLEKGTSLLANRILRKGMTAVDVGACFGYYAKFFANRVGPTGHVTAFEPEADNFALLAANCAQNAHILIRQMAVSDQAGVANLFISPHSRGRHSILADTVDSSKAKTVNVETTSLDIFFQQSDRPLDLIKIDVEGAEFKVLSGMQKILRNDRPSLIFETHHMTETAPEALEMLKEFGYDFFAIREKSGDLVQQPMDKLLQICTDINSIQEYGLSWNIFCKPDKR